MVDRGWRIGEKYGKWNFNFFDEVILIIIVDFIMKVGNVNLSGYKEV